ncbi:MAG: sodium/glutamate symporter [Pirellulaceae bacterium]
MMFAFLFVVTTLLVGVVLRQVVPLFRQLFIPASVVAGFVGLAIIQAGIAGGESSNWFATTTDLSKTLSDWPGMLIAVVFAGMLLNQGRSTAKESASRIGQQGLMVWVIVLGEAAVGLLATWMLIQPFYDVPNSFGMLIETGFAGGHGTAAAMGEVFAHPTINLTSGKDLGMLMATSGLVGGIVSGIAAVNIGVRLGWVTVSDNPHLPRSHESSNDPIGIARIDRETIDPLLLQVIWLAIALGVGLILKNSVTQFAGMIDGYFGWGAETDGAAGQLAKRLSVSSVAVFPLFIYTLFGGWLVRCVLSLFGQSYRIDGESISRLSSTAMDILVVAAIASLNLQAVVALIVPFLTLMVCGSIWAGVCLLVFAKWLLPKEHWFQLGLINYGMSTGTTATGFVLLRMVDPELKSGAAEDYALAAPLSAPFIGGGMITVALPLLVLERVWIGIPALVLGVIVIALIIIGRKWNASRD